LVAVVAVLPLVMMVLMEEMGARAEVEHLMKGLPVLVALELLIKDMMVATLLLIIKEVVEEVAELVKKAGLQLDSVWVPRAGMA
tara:strand:+ start:279 stop:530 length:252 start_codon:yes stop_codon:yes gene_type:complete